MGIGVDISYKGSSNSIGIYSSRATSRVKIKVDLYYSGSSRSGLYNYRITSKVEGGVSRANSSRNNNKQL